MIFINFTGLDVYLIGDLSKKCHTKIAKVFGVREEDLIITAVESYNYFKGVEQTSFNLVCRVSAPIEYEEYEQEVKEILFECCKDFSIHTRILFSYFDNSHYYENVNIEYPEYLTYDGDVEVEEPEYEEDYEYKEGDIYLGDAFKDVSFDEDDNAPRTIDDFFKKK